MKVWQSLEKTPNSIHNNGLNCLHRDSIFRCWYRQNISILEREKHKYDQNLCASSNNLSWQFFFQITKSVAKMNLITFKRKYLNNYLLKTFNLITIVLVFNLMYLMKLQLLLNVIYLLTYHFWEILRYVEQKCKCYEHMLKSLLGYNIHLQCYQMLIKC